MCFFFKHKPAYELLISDWSSDVCSSDLSIAHCVPLAALPLTRLMQCRAMNPATTAPQLRYLDELYLSAWRNTAKQFRESRVFKIVATGGDNDCLIYPVQIQVTLDIDCRCCGFIQIGRAHV